MNLERTGRRASAGSSIRQWIGGRNLRPGQQICGRTVRLSHRCASLHFFSNQTLSLFFFTNQKKLRDPSRKCRHYPLLLFSLLKKFSCNLWYWYCWVRWGLCAFLKNYNQVSDENKFEFYSASVGAFIRSMCTDLTATCRWQISPTGLCSFCSFTKMPPCISNDSFGFNWPFFKKDHLSKPIIIWVRRRPH